MWMCCGSHLLCKGGGSWLWSPGIELLAKIQKKWLQVHNRRSNSICSLIRKVIPILYLARMWERREWDVRETGMARIGRVLQDRQSHLKPITSSPYFRQNSNFSGVTNSLTERWRGVGWRYWPKVRMSTPTDLHHFVNTFMASFFSWWKREYIMHFNDSSYSCMLTFNLSIHNHSRDWTQVSRGHDHLQVGSRAMKYKLEQKFNNQVLEAHVKSVSIGSEYVPQQMLHIHEIC